MATVWDDADEAGLVWHPEKAVSRAPLEKAVRDAADLGPAFLPVPVGDPNEVR